MNLILFTKILRGVIVMSKLLFYTLVINAVLATTLIAGEVSGQAKSIDKIYLTLKLQNTQIAEIFETIEKETDFTFSYFTTNLNDRRTISIDDEYQSLGDILRKISRKANLQFKRVNEKIYVNSKKNSQPPVSEFVNAQTTLERVVSGKITNQSGEPIPGANVLVEGTTVGAITDVEGMYTINVPDNAEVLLVSFIGYLTERIEIAGRSRIDVALIEDIQSLQEIVVIGYGTQKKSDLTGAVGAVSGDELGKYVAANATQAIQGRIAGVRVESNGGAPGANALVTIRGSGTLSDSGPLYVIDGMLTGNMNALNPADIESVTVLKDASASAIYGSRAANGVVIVTTKKGRAGELSVDVDVSYGTQEVVNTLDWANARQYADIRNRANDNDGVNRAPANDTQFDPSIDTDIQAATLRSAPIFNANARIYGGGEHTTFSVSANHLDQTGILRNSDYSRTNVRANSTFSKGKFRLEETIGLTRTVNNPNGLFNKERDILPTIPLRDADGNFTATSSPDGTTTIYGVGNIGNSLGRATLEDRTVTRNTILGNVIGSYEIIKGLTYKLNLGLEYFSENHFTFKPTYFFNATTLGRQDFAQLDETNTNFLSTLAENLLSYEKSFGKHSLSLLAGYTEQKTTNRSIGVRGTGFPSNDIRVLAAAENVTSRPPNDQGNLGSLERVVGLRSYFGRVNYSFDGKYLFTATLRRDGSSLFRDDLRWGTFPSVAVGWNISNEPFMSGVSGITNLKLRASYGEVGSNNVAAYAIDPELNLFSEYIVGTGQIRAQGFSITRGVNRNIFWETTKTADIGIEFGLLENRLQVTIDYFNKKSEDVLVGLEPAYYTGFDNRIPTNAASVENKGLEFLASYSRSIGDLTFNVTGNFTILDNEVTALGVPDPIEGGGFTSNGLSATRTEVGQAIGAFYGYQVAGIYQSDQEASEDGRPNDSPEAGDFIFADLDGDGELTADDQTFLGSPIPDFEYGLSINAEYKGFDLSLFFNGVAGNEILNANLYRGFFDTEGNYLAEALNAWTPSNTNTNIPRNTLLDPGNNRRMSDFYLESGAYFRLRNFQLGYSLPENILTNIGIAKVRIYTSIQNLFTITDYTGYYPEVGRGTRDRGSNQDIFNAGVDESAYPTAKTYQFGVQLSF